MSNLDDWNTVAEIEQYHHYNDHCHQIFDKLNQIQAELTLVEDTIIASHHHIDDGAGAPF